MFGNEKDFLNAQSNQGRNPFQDINPEDIFRQMFMQMHHNGGFAQFGGMEEELLNGIFGGGMFAGPGVRVQFSSMGPGGRTTFYSSNPRGRQSQNVNPFAHN